MIFSLIVVVVVLDVGYSIAVTLDWDGLGDLDLYTGVSDILSVHEDIVYFANLSDGGLTLNHDACADCNCTCCCADCHLPPCILMTFYDLSIDGIAIGEFTLSMTFDPDPYGQIPLDEANGTNFWDCGDGRYDIGADTTIDGTDGRFIFLSRYTTLILPPPPDPFNNSTYGTCFDFSDPKQFFTGFEIFELNEARDDWVAGVGFGEANPITCDPFFVEGPARSDIVSPWAVSWSRMTVTIGDCPDPIACSPEIIRGTFTEDRIFRTWYNQYSDCAVETTPTSTTIVVTNTGTTSIDVNTIPVAPGDNITFTSFAYAGYNNLTQSGYVGGTITTVVCGAAPMKIKQNLRAMAPKRIRFVFNKR